MVKRRLSSSSRQRVVSEVTCPRHGRGATIYRGSRRYERGQAIVESVIGMLLICLILFGLLQIFHLCVARVIFDYSAFCSSRSASVGFADYLLRRTARVAAIGAGGDLITELEISYDDNPLSQFAAERVRIPEYLQGNRYLDYEYFSEENNDYGASLSFDINHGANQMVTAEVVGENYPLIFPMKGAYTTDDGIDLDGQAEVMDYSQDYL